MSILAPVASWMPLIVLPPGPINRPIFCGSILIVNSRGAYMLISLRGRRIAFIIGLRISLRASWACSKAPLTISAPMPSILRSSWMPQMPLSVPATLKSMSA